MARSEGCLRPRLGRGKGFFFHAARARASAVYPDVCGACAVQRSAGAGRGGPVR